MQKVWFQLVDTNGNNIATLSSIKPANVQDVDAFRNNVKKEYANALAQVDAEDLIVYANRVALETKQKPLDGIG